ncbi:MAG TPA: hypothetical protein DCP64_10055 [Sarcina sp.]|nr:hypothetical protein [Sarcina sp.]
MSGHFVRYFSCISHFYRAPWMHSPFTGSDGGHSNELFSFAHFTKKRPEKQYRTALQAALQAYYYCFFKLS